MTCATLLCAALTLALTSCAPLPDGTTDANASGDTGTIAPADTPTLIRRALIRAAVPAPMDANQARARRAVASMSLEEQVGQLIMAPLYAGTDPATMQSLIGERHVGAVLIIGNWNDGVASVRAAADTLQSYAPAGNRLIMATDQEGGLVQHLQGAGFDAMPSAVEQGRMTADALRSAAGVWGSQLAQAGINVDLAPVADTVTVDRTANAPIGMLDRDFGLDAAGNAAHAVAFAQGLRDAGVWSAVKHYPGLGAVTGNTDFTADGILDTTTTEAGPEVGAFATVVRQADPGLVMMSLATYERIDADHPAAFSSTIIDGLLRGTDGYDGVVTSDSLSAAAVGAVPVDQLGVRFVEAGGDLACIGETDYVQPIIDGLLARARSDTGFAAKVTRSARRVMALKYRMGLAV
ncbi:beta-glucosidase [Bifidobacterium ramosum]|uniref:beta-N-acetylhexosaminidase n=2 Tax=Bifidobacterium ramosum TaxID=1798158 RepID=A0A6L4WZG8_9BIFI|nr:glycoside hydrolase family 3 N-terminal domain-containing protein [Bifidobacterium ramosum]KAB8287526.1 beta-glucosidase [Bifidobacterium ramosum]NEG72247.1 beta-glucosidase [Bifidobacterium ramosum]